MTTISGNAIAIEEGYKLFPIKTEQTPFIKFRVGNNLEITIQKTLSHVQGFFAIMKLKGDVVDLFFYSQLLSDYSIKKEENGDAQLSKLTLKIRKEDYVPILDKINQFEPIKDKAIAFAEHAVTNRSICGK